MEKNKREETELFSEGKFHINIQLTNKRSFESTIWSAALSMEPIKRFFRVGFDRS